MHINEGYYKRRKTGSQRMIGTLANRVATRLATRKRTELAIAQHNVDMATFRQASYAEALLRAIAMEKAMAEGQQNNTDNHQPLNEKRRQYNTHQATTDLPTKQREDIGEIINEKGEMKWWTEVKRKQPYKPKAKPLNSLYK